VLPKLAALAKSDIEVKAKRHAIWAMGQLYRREAKDKAKNNPSNS